MKKKKTSVQKVEKRGSKLAEKAGLAIKNGFFLDTTWILSLMFEKKTKNLLKQVEGASNLKGYSLEQSIKRVKYHHQTARNLPLVKHLDLGLIEEIRTWKNSRNTMLKDMVSVHVSQDRMERLAKEGVNLYKKWNKSLKIIKIEMKKSGDHAGKEEISRPGKEKQ